MKQSIFDIGHAGFGFALDKDVAGREDQGLPCDSTSATFNAHHSWPVAVAGDVKEGGVDLKFADRWTDLSSPGFDYLAPLCRQPLWVLEMLEQFMDRIEGDGGTTI
jgi:hypothetical protein